MSDETTPASPETAPPAADASPPAPEPTTDAPPAPTPPAQDAPPAPDAPPPTPPAPDAAEVTTERKASELPPRDGEYHLLRKDGEDFVDADGEWIKLPDGERENFVQAAKAGMPLATALKQSGVRV